MRTPATSGGRRQLAERAGGDDTRAIPRSVPRQLRRRRAASWRCEPLWAGQRDPWTDERPADWTATEVESWQRTAEYLRAHQLYGRWQVPESVRAARQPGRTGAA
jgi:hypothetical protein